jgi:hypothetical protein
MFPFCSFSFTDKSWAKKLHTISTQRTYQFSFVIQTQKRITKFMKATLLSRTSIQQVQMTAKNVPSTFLLFSYIVGIVSLTKSWFIEYFDCVCLPELQLWRRPYWAEHRFNRCCLNVATHRWKIHKEKLEIISFIKKVTFNVLSRSGCISGIS